MSTVAAWFLYSIIVANLLGLAAVAGERALRDGARSGRWAWAAAMALSLAMPLLAWAGWHVQSVPAVPDSMVIPLAPIASASTSRGAMGASLDELLLLAWGASSAVLLGVVVLSWAQIRGERRYWRVLSLDGVRVLVTQDRGPAVYGFRQSLILVPEWALSLESRVRRLMLLHEGEHARAGDSRLALLGLLAIAVAPWNLPLWWQHRRLRQAIELDCDARVLRRAPDARSYGALLLECGRRRSRPVLGVALAEPASFLERRIRHITQRARSVDLRRVLSLAGVALLLTLAAAFTRDPTAPAPSNGRLGFRAAVPFPAIELPSVAPRAERADTMPVPFWTPMTLAPRLANGQEVGRALERNYPPLLRDAGIGGTVTMWFQIDREGAVLHTMVYRSSGYEALDQSARHVAEMMRFTPAENHGVPVGVWVQIPIVFKAGAAVGAPARSPATATAAELDNLPRVQPEMSTSVSRGTMLVEMKSATASSESVAGNGPFFTPMTRRPRITNQDVVAALLERNYPPQLRDAGISGTAVLWMRIDESGGVTEIRLAQSSGRVAIDDAAEKVAGQMRFEPAQNGSKTIPVWVQIPVEFKTR